MKLTQVLEKLSKTERNRLRKFIDSPYFNSNKNLLLAYAFLDEELREGREINKEILWSHLHGSRTFNDTSLRKTLTDLLSLTERFLSVEKYLQNDLAVHNNTLRAAIDRHLDILYNSSKANVEKSIKEHTLESSQNIYEQFLFFKNKMDLQTDFEKKKKSSKGEFGINNLLNLNGELDKLYMKEKLRSLCALNNFQGLSDIDAQISFREEVESMVRHIDLNQNLSIRMYYDTLRLYKGEIPFEEVNKMIIDFSEFTNLLDKSELQDIYEHWLNFMIRKVNQGIYEYFPRLFELFKIGVNNELLLENGHITPSLFRNICATACRLEEYEWASHFINENKRMLEAKYQDTAYSFNLSRIQWYKKDYDAVIETLRGIEYEDIGYNLNSKLMIMTSYFELKELDPLISFINSFKVFLRRKRNIPKNTKQAYYGFCNVLSNILKADDKQDPKRIIQARKELEENASIPNKAWVLEKIETLERHLNVQPQTA